MKHRCGTFSITETTGVEQDQEAKPNQTHPSIHPFSIPGSGCRGVGDQIPIFSDH